MASLLNHTFEHRSLVCEVILVTENVNVVSGFLFQRHYGYVGILSPS